jgi:uncharacterized protein YdaU (DUF1376 family)
VNYYRRYIADYGSKTKALTMVEDGAYTRLLDWYYEHEGPIPEDRAMTIARAMDAGEKKAVRHVLEGHFILRGGYWHNARADEELGIALPKLENLRKVARENGKKGGRKAAQGTESGSPKKPNPVPDPVADQAPDPEASSQPLNPSTKPNTAFPVVDTPRQPEAKSAGEAQGDPNPEVQRRRPGMVNLLRKHRVTGAEEHPLIVDRILATAKDEHIVAAFGEAARSKGGQPYDIGFLDAIVARISKADREASERVRGAADARVAETARRAEEQRAWEKHADA